MQKAIKDGQINLGFTVLPCAVLADGTRLLTTKGINKILGRANQKGGKKVDGNLPPFLNISIFKQLISNELSSSTIPIPFILKNGGKAFGYKAEVLPMICEVFLRARDLGVLSNQQLEHAAAADMIMRSLAKIGIIALIDEATGFQELRDKKFLQKLLDGYISDEEAKWAKTFNDSFYFSIFKLKNWSPTTTLRKKPHAVAHITKDLVYKRLAPGLLDALEERNPPVSPGRRQICHHQLLTRDQGLTHLKGHIFMLEKLMNASRDWNEFMGKVNIYLPYPNINEIFEKGVLDNGPISEQKPI